MNAFISGAAARAVFVEQQRLTYIDADWPDQTHQAPLANLGLLLADAPDVVELKDTSKTEALAQLLELWNRDRAIRMLQIVLDPECERDDVAEAAEYLDTLIEQETVRSWVENLSLALPAPSAPDLARIAPFSVMYTRTHSLLDLVKSCQASIQVVRTAWSALDDQLFSSDRERAQFEKTAIERGVFRRLVLAHAGREKMNNAVFAAYIELRSQKNARLVVATWEQKIGLPREKGSFDFIELPSEQSSRGEELVSHRGQRTGREQLEWVRKTQAGIIERLRKKDITKARSFIQDLIQGQLDIGDAHYAAKSLCLLSHEAKKLGFLALALDWSVKATELAPEDGWAHGQAGDAYLNMNRFADADRSFHLAYQNGEVQYGVSGHARVLRATYRLEEALSVLERLRAERPEDPQAHHVWGSIGEVLRDMGRLDEATATYREALQKFPYEPALWCGQAATLKDLGQLDAALSVYERAIERFPNESYAWAGSADVLKLLGEFDAALARYTEVIDRFPTQVIGYSGRADVMRERGTLSDAMHEYSQAIAKFEFEPAAYGGRAETLKDMGEYMKALEAYEDAVLRFEHEPYFQNGKANVLRLMGRLEEALATYDEAVSRFPFSIVARTGRAHQLKELGKYEQALDALEHIASLRKEYAYVRYQKASILAILKRYDEAETLLPTGEPRTRDEWVAEHVRGMIWLRTGRLDKAVALFTTGMLRNRFARERKFFQNALAITRIAQGQYQEALSHAQGNDDTVGALLTFHSFAALGRRRQAKAKFKQLSAEPRPVVAQISREIAARFRLVRSRPKFSTAWIEEKETEIALALAA